MKTPIENSVCIKNEKRQITIQELENGNVRFATASRIKEQDLSKYNEADIKTCWVEDGFVFMDFIFTRDAARDLHIALGAFLEKF